MDEYKGMKERIESLEKELVSKDKEIEALHDKNLNLLNEIDDITEMSLSERVFSWKRTLRGIVGDKYEAE